jgi:hypothetical protein
MGLSLHSKNHELEAKMRQHKFTKLDLCCHAA